MIKRICKHLLNNKTDATNLVFKLTLIFTNIVNLLHFKVLQYTKRVRKEKFRNHCRISMAIQKKLFNVTPFSWFNLLIFDDLGKVVKRFDVFSAECNPIFYNSWAFVAILFIIRKRTYVAKFFKFWYSFHSKVTQSNLLMLQNILCI